MFSATRLWSIVLAAGQGSRLQNLTSNGGGVPIPKQFCTFGGPKSMLQNTLSRMKSVVDRQQIIPVFAAQHRPWWQREPLDISHENLVIQPQNRGSAAGILLALAKVYSKDPKATVVVLPSDHFVARESVLTNAVKHAAQRVCLQSDKLILLGMTPTELDTDHGWMLPSRKTEGRFSSVECFVARPSRSVAEKLFENGGLWNTFIFVAKVQTLLDLYNKHMPILYQSFRYLFEGHKERSWRPQTLQELYLKIPHLDFSRQLLSRAQGHLLVLAVRPCGWTDLGTSTRLANCLREKDFSEPPPASHQVPVTGYDPFSLDKIAV